MRIWIYRVGYIEICKIINEYLSIRRWESVSYTHLTIKHFPFRAVSFWYLGYQIYDWDINSWHISTVPDATFTTSFVHPNLCSWATGLISEVMIAAIEATTLLSWNAVMPTVYVDNTIYYCTSSVIIKQSNKFESSRSVHCVSLLVRSSYVCFVI